MGPVLSTLGRHIASEAPARPDEAACDVASDWQNAGLMLGALPNIARCSHLPLPSHYTYLLVASY
jgi:hypothetical protein